MKTTNINVFLEHENAKLPTKATEGSAGFDIYSAHAFAISPGQTVMIDTGIIVDLPPGWCALIFGRSGLGSKLGIHLPHGVGLVDSDYRQSWKVPLYRNIVDKHYELEQEDLYTPWKADAGTRIAQAVFMPVNSVGLVLTDKIELTNRGGFGSTGK